MRRYALLPHTADARVSIEGSDLRELFMAGLEGMASIIKRDACTDSLEVSDTISLTASDITSLFIDFLSDILTRTQEKKVVYCKVEFQQLYPKILQGVIRGKKVNSFDRDVKAVTYHEADIVKNKQGNWETNIIFDI